MEKKSNLRENCISVVVFVLSYPHPPFAALLPPETRKYYYYYYIQSARCRRMHTRDKIKNKKENRINASVCALEGGKYRKNSKSSPPAKNKYVRRRRARAPQVQVVFPKYEVFSETTAFRTSRKVRRNITGPIYACSWAPAEMCVYRVCQSRKCNATNNYEIEY